MFKKMIIILLLFIFYVTPVLAQENDMPITREERIYKDSEARYFIGISFPNKGHPAIVSQERSLEDAQKNIHYSKVWFDKNNRITRIELLIHIDNSPITIYEYQYDTKGRLAVVISLYPNNDIKKTYRVKRTFFEKMKDKLGS